MARKWTEEQKARVRARDKAMREYRWSQAEAFLSGTINPDIHWLGEPKAEVSDCTKCKRPMQWIPWAEVGLQFWTGTDEKGEPLPYRSGVGSVGWILVCAKCKRLSDFDLRMLFD